MRCSSPCPRVTVQSASQWRFYTWCSLFTSVCWFERASDATQQVWLRKIASPTAATLQNSQHSSHLASHSSHEEPQIPLYKDGNHNFSSIFCALYRFSRPIGCITYLMAHRSSSRGLLASVMHRLWPQLTSSTLHCPAPHLNGTSQQITAAARTPGESDSPFRWQRHRLATLAAVLRLFSLLRF